MLLKINRFRRWPCPKANPPTARTHARPHTQRARTAGDTHGRHRRPPQCQPTPRSPPPPTPTAAPPRRWVFTASVASHARRCLAALGVDDLFLGIIDCKSCGLATKHSPEAFAAAMAIAGVTNYLAN